MSDAAGGTTRSALPSRCYFTGAYLILALVTGVAATVVVHLDLIDTHTPILRAHVMCGLFGAVGAAMAAIRKYYRALITEATARAAGQEGSGLDWSWGWVYYYFSRPVVGGVLGALAYTLSLVGVSALGEPGAADISDKGRHLRYALSFVSGFAVSHVLDRLNAVASQVFKAGTGGG